MLELSVCVLGLTNISCCFNFYKIAFLRSGLEMQGVIVLNSQIACLPPWSLQVFYKDNFSRLRIQSDLIDPIFCNLIRCSLNKLNLFENCFYITSITPIEDIFLDNVRRSYSFDYCFFFRQILNIS